MNTNLAAFSGGIFRNFTRYKIRLRSRSNVRLNASGKVLPLILKLIRRISERHYSSGETLSGIDGKLSLDSLTKPADSV